MPPAVNNVVHVRASRRQVLALLRRLPALAAGRGRAGEAPRALLVRLGLSALSHIRTAFVVKARGGTDQAGERWAPLKPSTIAYSRRHPGVLFPGKRRAPYAPSWMLTKKQRARWWQLYRGFGGRAPAGAAYHARGAPRGWAAALAWRILKSEGARTLIGTYGGVKVDILRDKGLLLNSLSPGVAVATAQPSVPPPRPRHQVFDIGPGEVIVGTNRKWAATHHRGVPGKLPQRRLWPPPDKWPPSWWNEILEQATMGVIDIALYLLRR